MNVVEGDDTSLAITRPFLKMIGCWIAVDPAELRRRNVMAAATIVGIVCLGVMSVTDVTQTLDNSSDLLYAINNVVTSVMCLNKVLIILARRTDFFNLIDHLQRNFLNSKYDDYERAILDICKRNCGIYIAGFSWFALATAISYFVTAAITNIGKNDTDRILPLKLYLDFETTTPYFEICFAIQCVFLVQIAMSYFCFDNVLAIMCLHTSCQFRILQYRLKNLNHIQDEGKRNENASDIYYDAFRDNIRNHQSLIVFSEKVEKVFSLFALQQVVVFSLLICLNGYQVVTADVSMSRRVTFLIFIFGCLTQMLLFTYGCDRMIQDSTEVGVSMYSAPWIYLPMDNKGRMLRNDLRLVVARSRTPCYLSAGGFSIISLETFTKVLSTSFSYFTLIRQSTATVED